MTLTTPIPSIIESLEKTNDPAVAYFSFIADDSGEHGAIRANKEGLRRFALELLKKSVEMEERRDGRNLCFQPADWIISDAGYDLIRSVKPEYVSRSEIIASRTDAANNGWHAEAAKEKRWFFTIMVSILLGAAAAVLVMRWFS